MAKEFYSLYNVVNKPCLGMLSSIDPAAVPDGYFPLIQNLRYSNVALEFRGGSSEYRTTTVSGTTNLPSGTVVGRMYDPVVGDYIALSTGGTIKVYKHTGSGWTDITLVAIDDAPYVWFEKITLPNPGTNLTVVNGIGLTATNTSLSYIVVQNGISPPQITAAGALTTATPLRQVTQGIVRGNPSKTKATPMVFDYLTVTGTLTHSSSSTNTTSSNGTVTVATSGTVTTTSQCINLNTNASTTVNSTVLVQFSDTAALTSVQPSQMQIVLNGLDSTVWDSWMVEIGNSSSTFYVVHKPGLTTPQSATVSDRYLASLFDCSSVATGATAATTSTFVSFPSFTVDRLRFTYVGVTPAATKTIPIYGVAFGANVPFGQEFGVTMFDPLTAIESPFVAAENLPPPTLREVGGTAIPGVTLAASPLAKYRYQIQSQETTSGRRFLCYSQSPGGRTFQILNFLTSTSDTTGAGKMFYWNIDTIEYGAWTAPSVFTKPIPSGGPMAVSGDRFFVGSLNGPGSSATRDTMAFSDKRMPNRFTLLTQVVQGQVQPGSGGEALFAGETIWSIVPQNSGIYAGDAVIVHTDKAVYQAQGVDAIQLGRPTNLGPYGTVSPGSVKAFQNDIVWVSPEKELRTLGQSLGSLSSRQVEDVLTGIPAARLAYVEAETFRDRLYIAYTPSGGSLNTRALVFDARVGGWSDDLIGTSTGASFCKWAARNVSGVKRLLALDTTGWTFEYDLSTAAGDRYVTATTTQQPVMRLVSKVLSRSMMERFRLGDVAIVSDDMGAVEWDTIYTERKTSDSVTGKLNMNGAGDKVWRLNRGTNENERVGQIGLGVQLEITGSAAPGKKIYSLGVWLEDQGTDGADRA